MDSSGKVGERLGSYELVRVLGRGGMGEVWLAENVVIHSQVAIKLVTGDVNDHDAATRFLREAKATAKIRHPGVIAVTDYGSRAAGGSYLVMELLEGRTLGELLERGPLAEAVAVDFAIQIAEALAAAHEAGVVHRDLKPGNIFLTNDPALPSKMRVKLLDFGIAKSIAASDVGVATTTGLLVGTPVYMAPEQCAPSRGPIDERTDLYALGIVLYEAVTGRPPFRGPTLGDLIDQHLNATPPRPRSLVPPLSDSLDALVMTLLAKQPAARLSSAAEVAARLRGLGSGRLPAQLEATMPAAVAATARVDATGETVSTLAGPQATAMHAASLDRPPRSRHWRWVVVGIACVGAALASVAIWRARSNEPAKVDVSRLDPAALGAACDRGQADACAKAATDELHGAKKPDLTRVFSRALLACDRRNAEGCLTAASLYLDGSGIRANYARSRELAEQACTLDSGAGCSLAAQLSAEGTGGAADPARAAQLAARGCDLGDASACVRSSTAIRFGLGAEKDVTRSDQLDARAAQLAESGCERDDGRSCLIHGLLLADDPARSTAILSRACDLHADEACAELAMRTAYGMGVAKDPERARRLMTEGCDRGQPMMCDRLTADYLQGMTGPPDHPRARALATRICTEFGDRSCLTLGAMYERGLGVPKDLTSAALYLGKACAAGVTEACGQAAGGKSATDPVIAAAQLDRACGAGNAYACYLRGKQERKAKRGEAARRDFELACELSNGAYGCSDLGELLIDGVGGPADPAEGRRRMQATCGTAVTALHARACSDLAERLRDGRGMTTDLAEAARLFELACNGGVPQACESGAALLNRRGAGLTPDPVRVKALRARRCELDPPTCPRAK